jgi:hypothetical protein
LQIKAGAAASAEPGIAHLRNRPAVGIRGRSELAGACWPTPGSAGYVRTKPVPYPGLGARIVNRFPGIDECAPDAQDLFQHLGAFILNCAIRECPSLKGLNFPKVLTPTFFPLPNETCREQRSFGNLAT